MRRREFITFVCGVVTALPISLRAAGAPGSAHIGFIKNYIINFAMSRRIPVIPSYSLFCGPHHQRLHRQSCRLSGPASSNSLSI